MQFETFRELRGWTLEAAAEALRVPGDPCLAGFNPAIISRHERGLTFPSPEHIARYEELTEGAVSFGDWAAIRKAAKGHPEGRLPPRTRGRRKEEEA